MGTPHRICHDWFLHSTHASVHQFLFWPWFSSSFCLLLLTPPLSSAFNFPFTVSASYSHLILLAVVTLQQAPTLRTLLPLTWSKPWTQSSQSADFMSSMTQVNRNSENDCFSCCCEILYWDLHSLFIHIMVFPFDVTKFRTAVFLLWQIYKVVQIWLGWFVCKQVTVCPGHIWTTLYMPYLFVTSLEFFHF
jgi:hypothetical protein